MESKVKGAVELLAQLPQDQTCYPLPDQYMAALEQLRPTGRCRCMTCQALRRIQQVLRLRVRVA